MVIHSGILPYHWPRNSGLLTIDWNLWGHEAQKSSPFKLVSAILPQQKATTSTADNPIYCSLLYFLRWGFSVNLEYSNLARLTRQWAPGSHIPVLPQHWSSRRAQPAFLHCLKAGGHSECFTWENPEPSSSLWELVLHLVSLVIPVIISKIPFSGGGCTLGEELAWPATPRTGFG